MPKKSFVSAQNYFKDPSRNPLQLARDNAERDTLGQFLKIGAARPPKFSLLLPVS
jgi:hypothetical protein